MTKKEVKKLIKRYPQIIHAVKQDLRQAVFYISNRKQVVEITEEVKSVCKIIDIVYTGEKNSLIKQMIKDIIIGQSDIFTMNEIYYEKNAYYTRKQAFVQKVYACCISWGLVSFEEIINEETAL